MTTEDVRAAAERLLETLPVQCGPYRADIEAVARAALDLNVRLRNVCDSRDGLLEQVWLAREIMRECSACCQHIGLTITPAPTAAGETEGA